MPHCPSARAVIRLVRAWTALVWVKAENQADKLQELSQKLQRERPPWHKYKDYDHPEDGQHRTAEQFNWRSQNRLSRFTAIAAVAAAVGTGFTFYETWRQANAAWQAVSDGKVALQAARDAADQAKRQADIAQQSLLASNRTWLNIDIPGESVSIRWLQKNAEVRLSENYKAFGPSPVYNVGVFSNLVVRGSFTEVIDACNQTAGGERYFFPSEKIELNQPPLVFNGYVIQLNPKDLFVNFDVVTCVGYNVLGDPKRHFTGRAYALGNYDKWGECWGSYIPVNQDFDAGSMCLKPSESVQEVTN